MQFTGNAWESLEKLFNSSKLNNKICHQLCNKCNTIMTFLSAFDVVNTSKNNMPQALNSSKFSQCHG